MEHHRRKKYAPQYSAEPHETPVCARYARCEGCPYPRHGFICWGKDGACLKDYVSESAERIKNAK